LDQKEIAPRTFIQQAVKGNAVVPEGAHPGNTFPTIAMRPDYVLDNAEKQLGKPLHGVFARRNAAKFFGGMQQSEILAQQQSPRIAFKLKAQSSLWILPL
jgi:hypothetical protein